MRSRTRDQTIFFCFYFLADIGVAMVTQFGWGSTLSFCVGLFFQCVSKKQKKRTLNSTEKEIA